MTLDAYLVDVLSNDLKQALEDPIIFITQTDYIEHMFNSVSALKHALASHQDLDYTYFMELMTKHHTDWLAAIAEINAVAQNLNADLKDAVSYSITYTINCVKNKSKLLPNYVKANLIKQEMKLMEPHIKKVDTLSNNMVTALKDKEIYFKQCTDDEQLTKVMREETDNLLDWLDSMYSKSIISLCKLLEIWCQELGTKIHKALVITSQRIADSLETNLSNNEQSSALDYDLLILEQKLKDLHIELSKSKSDTSTNLALVDLKKELETKLEDIESTNKSHMSLKSSVSTIISNNINTLNKKMPVFDHQLPSKQRARLVGQMLKVWKIVFGKRADANSNISFVCKKTSQITKGLTFVDKNDNVYYYDNDGHYSRAKDIENDVLAESKDIGLALGDDVFKRLDETYTDGPEYYYDDIGRYYEDNGKKIYKDIDSDTEYEPDEFGNLIQLRKCPEKYFDMEYAPSASIKEDSEYLKNTVGGVLKKCLSKVFMYQPEDPIKYLASLLIRHVKLEKEKVDNMQSVEGFQLERSEQRLKLECTPATTVSSLMLVSETYCSESSCFALLSESK